MTENKTTLAETNIQKAWDFIFTKLYYPKTHMIYDYLFKDSIDESVDFYPNAEEIRNSVPNPCGWGTGMEDSTLNLCTMLEAVESRYQATHDPEMKKYFDMMYDGLAVTGTVSGCRGFIARCVAPCDGKSVYMDSSRDQYTHWVYAGHLIYNSVLADAEQKRLTAEVLVDVAKKAEHDITKENGGYMLRLDGGRGRVSQMLSAQTKLGPHEVLRLPMFFAAAYEVLGDSHWLGKYRECRDELLNETEAGFTLEWIRGLEKTFGYVYGIYQAQYSFRLLYDTETDDEYKKRYLRLMQIAAEGAKAFLDTAYANIGIYNITQPYYRPWRESETKPNGEIDGYKYNIPILFDYGESSDNPEIVWKNLRNAGETVIINNLCPDNKLDDKYAAMYTEIIESTNFDGPKSYWPALHCSAWWGLAAGMRHSK